MTGNLRIFLAILLLASVTFARSGRGDGIKMEPRPGPRGGEKKKPSKEEAEEKNLTPFEQALKQLDTWPSTEALDAAATLALEGPEAEKLLIQALKTATPAQSAGIAFILGEVGGDASVPALQAVAARPAMSEYLPEVFKAIGKLEGANAVRRILPFLRHPRRPSRLAAEAWLKDHINESHAERLETFLEEPATGPRLSAFRLLSDVAPDRAEHHAFELLGDEAWELCRAAAVFFVEHVDENVIERISESALSARTRLSAYSVLTLVAIEDWRGGRLVGTNEKIVDMLLHSPRGILSADKLNRGAAAIALARIGNESDNEEIEKLLDREIIDVLLDTLGGPKFFKDYPALSQPARDRFGLLTGILDRRTIPELWRWWHENRENFVARRTLREIVPDSIRTIRVRAMSSVEPALATTLFSNVASDALKPETVGVGYVFLLPADFRDLAGFLARNLLPLPESGVVDPARVMGGEGRGIGPDAYVTVSVNGRSRTVTAKRGAVPPALLKVFQRLRNLRDVYAWQRYWDRDTYRNFEDFIEKEGDWFAAGHTPEEDAERMKDLILSAIDDLPSRTEQIRAVDLLLELEAPLSDRDCYRIAIFLGNEPRLTPLAIRSARLLAESGRPIVIALLTEWAKKHTGQQSIDLLSEAITSVGTLEIVKATKSSQVVVRRAALRAAPTSLEGEDLLTVLRRGTKDKVVAVRREAVLALGRSPAPTAIPLLTAALADAAEEIRITAVEAFGMLRVAEVVPILTKQLNSDDSGLRVAAVRALCATKLEQAVTPVLLALMTDTSPVVREIAAGEVTAFGAGAVEGLTRIAVDSKQDAKVRALAVDAVVRIDGAHVFDLLDALLSDPTAEVADQAALALASRGRKQAVPRLLEALEKGRRRSDAIAGLECLSCQSFPLARQGDLQVIYKGWWDEHKNEAPARWFAEALERKGYGSPLMSSLFSGEPDPKIAPLLVGAFADEDWFIIVNANLWLRRMTGKNFGDVSRFSSQEQIHGVQVRWHDWLEIK